MRHVEECMGTVFSFDIRDEPTPQITGALEQAVAWLHHVDRVFSTYQADSDISRIGRGELSVADADPLVAEVLARGDLAVRDGEGAFTLQPRGILDPSAVVKGWAVERASDMLRAAGSANHVVNGGGDVQAVGNAEPGRPWRVAVADPRDRTRVAMVLGARDRFGVATSGRSERGDHIVSPRGDSAAAMLSITVIGSSLTDVDIAATTAFALGDQARAWIDRHPGLAAFAIYDDGRMWSSERLAPYVLG